MRNIRFLILPLFVFCFVSSFTDISEARYRHYRHHRYKRHYKRYGRRRYHRPRYARYRENYRGMSCRNPSGAYQCMVCNCFNEAGGESYQGQVAVGKVVMTRVGLRQYPRSVCGVVKQPRQFSWYNSWRSRRSVPYGHSCFQAAKASLKFRGFFADHYYASYIRKPRWARRMRGQTTIGRHRFYAAFSPRSLSPQEQYYAGQGTVVASLIDTYPFLEGILN